MICLNQLLKVNRFSEHHLAGSQLLRPIQMKNVLVWVMYIA